MKKKATQEKESFHLLTQSRKNRRRETRNLSEGKGQDRKENDGRTITYVGKRHTGRERVSQSADF